MEQYNAEVSCLMEQQRCLIFWSNIGVPFSWNVQKDPLYWSTTVVMFPGSVKK